MVERKNRSIVETSQAMLHDQNMSKFLWAEATNIVVYVQNGLPHQDLDKKTPKEIFTGVKPDIGHLHLFGCPVDFHVSKDKVNKLEATKRKGMFVGYSEDSKEFRIYISGQRKVQISRDVTFDEDVSLRKERNLPLPPPPEDKNVDIDILEGPSLTESEKEIVDDPMEPINPLDPPPSDPPTRKRPLCLKYTL